MRIHSEEDFDQCNRQAKLLATVSAWSELDLWRQLAESAGPVELDDLPGNPRALEITAAILANAGLLVGHGTRWQLSSVARSMFENGSLPNAKSLSSLRQLGRLADVLRSGGPVVDDDGKPVLTSGGVIAEDRDATRAFLDMLYRRSAHSASSSADWIVPRVGRGGRIIDIGGGHGRYAQTFADRGLEATLFDMPLVVELAKERHGSTLAYRSGNFHEDDFGGPYDAAFLSNIVHGESDRENCDMLARIHRALAPGGIVVIKDMFIDEQGRDPEIAVHFGLTMLYYTRAGRSYSLRDVARWFDVVGFSPPEVVAMETHCLVFGQVP